MDLPFNQNFFKGRYVFARLTQKCRLLDFRSELAKRSVTKWQNTLINQSSRPRAPLWGCLACARPLCFFVCVWCVSECLKARNPVCLWALGIGCRTVFFFFIPANRFFNIWQNLVWDLPLYNRYIRDHLSMRFLEGDLEPDPMSDNWRPLISSQLSTNCE